MKKYFLLFILISCKLFAQPQQKEFRSLFVNNFYDTTKPYDKQLDPRAISFVKDYIQKQGAELNRMKTWGKSYFNLYDGILSQYKIPKEMKYLSVIESHLQHNLVSWAGAVGPWQIMDYEAKRFGLRTGKVDDRMDYTKSTHVACKLMNELYNEFGDWLLVVAAYNGGAGRVKNAIKKSNSKDFWNLQYYLMEETRNHVKKFIATHYLFEGNGQIENNTLSDSSFTDSSFYNNLDSIVVNGRYKNNIICKYVKLSVAKFDVLNPNFNTSVCSGKKYNMRLPKEVMAIFINKKYIILQESLDDIIRRI